MEYNSIYDVLNKRFLGIYQGNYRYMTYRGTLDNIFEELGDALLPKVHLDKELYVLIFHPTRIVRSLIDSKELISANSINDDYIGLMNKVMNLCLDVYDYKEYSEKNVLNKLNNLKDSLKEIINRRVEQEYDFNTWRASNPKLSIDSANRLYALDRYKPILFIPLAHGGVSAGIDVFMRYNQLAKSEESILHPVRYSRYKSHDDMPLISNVEKEYFKCLANTHHTIIFDEDSGPLAETIIGVQRYFIDVLEIPAYAMINSPSMERHKLITP